MWLIAALIGLVVAFVVLLVCSIPYALYAIGYYQGRIDLLDELRNRMEG